ncbi:unnamed protein product [Soboliphyme baturini]|uniref:Uncharacterized protein n=1 Tax=Soboliphyme baturini TaxID=241478 RepID=A0A183ICU3_9BILA|nr:unnamed protein product [Soboliphyme baturini]
MNTAFSETSQQSVINTGIYHGLVRVRLTFEEKIENEALQMTNRTQRPQVFDMGSAGGAFPRRLKHGRQLQHFAEKLRRCKRSADAVTSSSGKEWISKEMKGSPRYEGG